MVFDLMMYKSPGVPQQNELLTLTSQLRTRQTSILAWIGILIRVGHMLHWPTTKSVGQYDYLMINTALLPSVLVPSNKTLLYVRNSFHFRGLVNNFLIRIIAQTTSNHRCI